MHMRKGKRLLQRGLISAVWAMPASATFATQFIFDLRATDGTNSASVSAAGQTVNADVLLLIAGGDGNTQNDAPNQLEFSLGTSTGGLLGDISLTLAAPFNTLTSSVPAPTD